MFATIKTNGATHIAIYIPANGAEKSLPAIASMLENNAVFIKKGWNDVSVVEPEMGITLGSSFKVPDCEVDVVIGEIGCVLDESFVISTPETFTSNQSALKKRDDEISRLKNELAFVKSELERARNQLESLVSVES